jgi:hypothetical protein
MSVRRENAVINQQLDLRFEFRYDRNGNLFDPSSITKVEILDTDHSTVLQTLTGAQIVNLEVGRYQVIANAITEEKKIYDVWTHVIDGVTYVLEDSTNVLSTVSPTNGMSSFVALTKLKVQDAKGVLADPADYETLIQEALKHYSRLRPVIEVESLTGDGNSYFTIPANFEYRWSWIRNIEYPLDGFPPEYIDKNNYKVEETGDGVLVRFIDTNYPGDGDNFLFRYARRHTITETANTIMAADKDAFCLLAAYYCCMSISTYYSQTQDPTLEADVIAYRTKGDEFKTRAQDFLKAFNEKVKPDQTGVIGEWDMEGYWNTNFLFRDRDHY